MKPEDGLWTSSRFVTKTDRFSFAFVTLVVLTGLVLAFVNPASAHHHPAGTNADAPVAR